MTMNKKYAGLRKEYYDYQAVTPALDGVTLEEAIQKLIQFKDDPKGEVENEIDSILIDYETEFLEDYLEDLAKDTVESSC
jgi:hypothetical protein